MRKVLSLWLVLLCFVANGWAQLADGDVVLKNVATGTFLGGSNEWGTRTSVTKHGQFMTLTKLGDGKYTLDTHVSQNSTSSNHYFGTSGFLDAEATALDIECVESGVYTIKCDGAYLMTNKENTTVDFKAADEITDAAKWIIMTRDQYILALLAANPAVPVDATALVPDADFSRFNLDFSKWVGNSVMAKSGSSNASGMTAAGYNVEKWGGNSTSIDFGATITDLPNGLYTVKFQGFYRYNNSYSNTNDVAAATHADGTEKLNVTFNANDVSVPFMSIADEDAVATYGMMPFSQTEASEAFSRGCYQHELEVEVTDGTLTLWVVKDEADHEGTDWTVLDNIELYCTYGGGSDDVIQAQLASFVEECEQQYPNIESVAANSDVKANYMTTLQNAKEATEDYLSHFLYLKSSRQVFATSISNYEQLADVIAECDNLIAESTVDELTEALTSYHDELQAKYNAGTADDTYCLSAQDELDIITRSYAKYLASETNPLDVTADFIGLGDNDWTTQAYVGNNPYYNPPVKSISNSPFDYKQTLTGLMPGYYRLYVNGFYHSNNQSDIYYILNGQRKVEAYTLLYAGNKETGLAYISRDMEEYNRYNNGYGYRFYVNSADSYYYLPFKDPYSESMAFSSDLYRNCLQFYVPEGESQITIGIRQPEQVGNYVTFNPMSWNLQYIGLQIPTTNPTTDSRPGESELALLIEECEELYPNIDDVAANNEVKTNYVTALLNAKSATEDYYAHYTNVKSMRETLNTSISNYEQLADVIAECNNLISESTADELTEALTSFRDELQAKYNAGTADDDDCLSAQDELDIITRSFTSETNPLDVTADFIGLGNYDWTTQAYVQNSTYYNPPVKSISNSPFDYKQTLTGLMPGYYRLYVNGFYHSNSQKDIQDILNGRLEVGAYTLLYAGNKETGLAYISRDMEEYNRYYEGYGRSFYVNSADSYYYLPYYNAQYESMAFSSDLYRNCLQFYVPEGESQITIGIRQPEQVGNYVTFNPMSWNLQYIGLQTPTTNPTTDSRPGESELALLIEECEELYPNIDDVAANNEVKANYVTALLDAKSATEDYYAHYTNVKSMRETLVTSISNYEQLASVIAECDDQIAVLTLDELTAALTSFRDELQAKYNAGTADDDDCLSAQDEFDDIIFPYAKYLAGETNPLDVTANFIGLGDNDWTTQAYVETDNYYDPPVTYICEGPFDYKQTLTGLMPGYYRLYVNGFYSNFSDQVDNILNGQGGLEDYPLLYAGNKETGLAYVTRDMEEYNRYYKGWGDEFYVNSTGSYYYLPSYWDPESVSKAFSSDLYRNCLQFYVPEGESQITIGIRQPDPVLNYVMFNPMSWNLQYIGLQTPTTDPTTDSRPGESELALLVEECEELYPNIDDVAANKDVKANYVTSLQNAKEATSDFATYFKELKTKRQALDTSVNLYQWLAVAIGRCNDLMSTFTQEEAITILTAYRDDFQIAYDARTADDEFCSMAEQLSSQLGATEDNPAGVELPTSNWTTEATTSRYSDVLEIYNQTFDYHNTLTNLLPGYYRLHVNAFYRSGSVRDIQDALNGQGGEEPYALLYAGDKETGLALISSEMETYTNLNYWDGAQIVVNSDVYYLPNNLPNAYDALYSYELYNNYLQFYVPEGESEMTIGIRKLEAKNYDWVAFQDHWYVEYVGLQKPTTDPTTDSRPIYKGTYELADGETYGNLVSMTCDAISYTRTFNNTDFQPLYVPFAMEYDDWSEKADIYKLQVIVENDVDDNGTVDEWLLRVVKLGEGSSMKANTPYVIKPKETGDMTIELPNTVLKSASGNSIWCASTDYSFYFTGNYQPMTIQPDSYFAMSGGALRYTEQNVPLKAQRWYMEIRDKDTGQRVAPSTFNAPSAVKGIRIFVDGEDDETSIHPINGGKALQLDGAIYNLNGQRLAAPTKGINIINGKKVFVR